MPSLKNPVQKQSFAFPLLAVLMQGSLLFFLLFFLLSAGSVSPASGVPVWISGLLLFPFALYCYQLRHHVQTRGRFLLLHLPLLLFPFLFPGSFLEKALWAAVILLLICTSCFRYFRCFLQEEKERPAAALGLCFFLGYGYGLIAVSLPHLEKISLLCFMVFTLCEILHYYLCCMEYYFELQQDAALPRKKIRQNGRLVIGSFLLAFAGAAFLSLSGWLQGAYRWVLHMITLLLQKLVRFLATEDSQQAAAPVSQASFPPPALPEGTSSLSPFWKIFSQALSVIFTGLFFLCLLALVLYLLYRLYLFFHQSPSCQELQETASFLSKEERLPRKKKGSLFAKRLWGNSPEIRIRRLYKKYVQSRSPSGYVPSPSQTPKEIQQELDPAKESAEITSYYEKARYYHGTAKDYEALRKLLKKM